MKNTKYAFMAAVMAAAMTLSLGSCKPSADSNKLVILHTNDTHSQIDPDHNELGGVMRRMAVIDSVRAAEPNVLLVDAGDAVQGTLYYYLFGGLVEQEIMNIMGVDMRILGNHEFDNGTDSLATILKLSNAEKIASNYKLDSSALDGLFVPYVIKEFGNKKIGFIGINLDPEGIIAKGNYEGVEFLPIVATANVMAEKLKKEEKADAVIALTHIGYNPTGIVGDSILALNSRNIDIIIGGHTHDVIDPTTEKGARRSNMTNLDGKPVLIVQTGKAGRYIGKIEIDLDRLSGDNTTKYELIPLDGPFDSYHNEALANTIARYSAGVDSLMHVWIGYAPEMLPAKGIAQQNFFADFVLGRGRELDEATDFSIVNKGSLRADIPQGQFSEGHIINMEPFRNNINVVELKGSDIKEIFDVMATTDGNGISKNVRASYGINDNGAYATDITINGKPLNLDKTYKVATIDYLANGGDYMTAFTRGKVIAASPKPVFEDILDYFRIGAGKDKDFVGDNTNRWSAAK